LPAILIIHLKRFDFTRSLKGRKLDNLIEFPLEGLNLSPFVSSVQKEDPVYDLFAIAVRVKLKIISNLIVES
jgi:hypothetical protein